MNKLAPLGLIWRDTSHTRIIRQSLLIALAALIHVPIALALLNQAAEIFV